MTARPGIPLVADTKKFFPVAGGGVAFDSASQGSTPAD